MFIRTFSPRQGQGGGGFDRTLLLLFRRQLTRSQRRNRQNRIEPPLFILQLDQLKRPAYSKYLVDRNSFVIPILFGPNNRRESIPKSSISLASSRLKKRKKKKKRTKEMFFIFVDLLWRVWSARTVRRLADFRSTRSNSARASNATKIKIHSSSFRVPARLCQDVSLWNSRRGPLYRP